MRRNNPSKSSKARTSAAKRVKKGERAKGSNSVKDQSGSWLIEATEKIRQEIWPVERSTLFRPERLKYVRKMIKPDGCVFCAAVDAGVSQESLLLYMGESAIVVMNKYPYNAGHLLILPKRHCGEFLELTAAEQKEINQCLKTSIAALKNEYKPSGFNVGLNLGSAAGAGIPEHLHYHLIPRWSGDTNFFALIADTKVVVETLEDTYKRLLPYYKNVG